MKESTARSAAAQEFVTDMILTADGVLAVLHREMPTNALHRAMASLAEVVFHAREAVTAAQTADEPIMTLVLARALREVLIATDLHRDAELPKY